MAHIYLGPTSRDAASLAERDLLKRCERLPDTFTILHGVPWVGHRQGRSTVGEVDFLILHARHGILVLEVKGGAISTRRIENHGAVETQWFSQPGGSGPAVEIKDPFQQADRNRHNLQRWLENDPRTRGMNWDAIFPAVALPDSHLSGDLRPDGPREIIIDMSGMDTLERRLLDIFSYWKGKYGGAGFQGEAAVKAVVELLMPTADLRPSLALAFQREGKQIDQLTAEQFEIFKMLRLQNQAAIVGGAGTGKTLLAMEKARRLVDEGLRVLFVCFNSNLNEWIQGMLDSKNNALLEVVTFHQLTELMIRRSGLPTDPRMKDFYDRAADLLQDSVERLRKKPAAHADLFDAIIVDEGQDFHDEWWIPLPDLLKDRDRGIFYIFFDDNQRLYTQLSNIPFKAQPFTLIKNCRNSQAIFKTMRPYLPPNDQTECIGPAGRKVEIVRAQDKAAVVAELKSLLLKLGKEGIKPEDIIILTPASKARSEWKDDEQIGKFVLSWNLQTTMVNSIRVCTIYQFKGLERSVVILTEMDKAHEEIVNELIYVGLSRARNHVIILGQLPGPTHS